MVKDLETELTQDFSSPFRMHVDTIRPYLLLHNNPSGDIKLSVYNGVLELVSLSQSVSSLYSNASISDDYAHGWFSFSFSNAGLILDKDTIYTLKLEADTGYTYSSSQYVSWIAEHENLTNDTDGNNYNYQKNPFSFQVWYQRNFI